MNYKKHYENLISKARNRSILKSEYSEVHHIIPKSLGGDDSKDNLISLFPEEHLVAHLLLVKIYPHNQKLIYAANMMTNGSANSNQNGRITNKEYSWVKKMHAKAVSEFHSGKVLSQETRQKIGNGNRGKVRTEEYKNKMSEIKLQMTDETKKKISESVKRTYQENGISAETKQQLSTKALEQWADKEKMLLARGQDITQYEFIHSDGRCVICYKSSLPDGDGASLIAGRSKKSKGWEFTGRKFKRIEI